MKQITSKDNAVYKSIRRLARSSHARREEGRILLDGVHLVRAYLKRFGPLRVEVVTKRSAMEHREIKELTEQTTSLTMSDSLFDQLAPVASPVGILAVAPLPTVSSVSEGQAFQVVLDGVQDPGNVGAILRSAAAAGARMAHLSPDCADPWSPKSLRGGMGAQFLLAIQRHDSLTAMAISLPATLVACAPESPVSVFDADLRGDVAFVIGGEGAGVSRELIARAQQRIRIPMRPGIESLNVGAAAAVCFYEWVRQAAAQSRHPAQH
jgi:RNA methyltransferase, TrmH family